MKLLTTEWLVSDVDLVVEGNCLFSPLLGSWYIDFCFLLAESRRHKDSTNIRFRILSTTSLYVVHVEADDTRVCLSIRCVSNFFT